MRIMLLSGACLLNAIVICGILQIFYKRIIKSDIRYIVTFATYLIFCFYMASGGNSLLVEGFAALDTLLFMLYTFGGIATCTVLYIIERVNRKNREIYGNAAMDAARKKKK